MTAFFNSLIMSLFLYAIEVWGSALECQYLSPVDKFCERAYKYGYLLNFTFIKDILRARDKLLWEQITKDCDHCLRDLLPMQRRRSLRSRGHNYILPRIRTERFKRTFITDVFLILFRLKLVFSLVMNFCCCATNKDYINTLTAGQSYLRHVIFFHLRPAEYYNMYKMPAKNNFLLQFWYGENHSGYFVKKFTKIST